MLRSFVLLVVLALLSLSPYSSSRATDYSSVYNTGKRDFIENVEKQMNQKEEVCSKQDLMDIKRFNRKVKSKMNEYEKLAVIGPQLSYTRNEIEIKRYSRKMGSVWDFFQSEEYNFMKPVYKRCGVELDGPDFSSGVMFP